MTQVPTTPDSVPLTSSTPPVPTKPLAGEARVEITFSAVTPEFLAAFTKNLETLFDNTRLSGCRVEVRTSGPVI